MSDIVESPYDKIREAIVAGDFKAAEAIARAHPYDPNMQLTLEMWEKLKE